MVVRVEFEELDMSKRQLLPRQREASTIGSSRENEPRETSPGSSTASRKRGPLVTAACNACRKRKVKCDGNKPQCSNCSKRTIPCTYDETSKVERLRIVQERLKEAHESIDSLRKHIEALTESSSNRHQRASLQQVSGEADRIKTTVTQIGTEIPARPSDSFTQYPASLASPQAMDVEDGTSISFPPPTLVALPGPIVVIIPSIVPLVLGQDPLSRLGEQTNNPDLNTPGYVRIFHEETQTNLYTTFHSMLPLNYVAADELSKPCILQQLRCRECLAEGMALEDVLGPELLDFSCLIYLEQMPNVHPFTSWVIQYVDAFAGSNSLDWALRIAAIYCMFYTFRWLVHPSAQHYSRVPDFMKSTPIQLFVPHTFWINFVTLPAMRNEYALRPHADHLRQWSNAFLQAKINWSNPDITSIVAVSPLTGACNITPEFEAVLRRIENWYFPL